jgi:hypothetical protein
MSSPSGIIPHNLAARQCQRRRGGQNTLLSLAGKDAKNETVPVAARPSTLLLSWSESAAAKPPAAGIFIITMVIVIVSAVGAADHRPHCHDDEHRSVFLRGLTTAAAMMIDNSNNNNGLLTTATPIIYMSFLMVATAIVYVMKRGRRTIFTQ